MSKGVFVVLCLLVVQSFAETGATPFLKLTNKSLHKGLTWPLPDHPTEALVKPITVSNEVEDPYSMSMPKSMMPKGMMPKGMMPKSMPMMPKMMTPKGMTPKMMMMPKTMPKMPMTPKMMMPMPTPKTGNAATYADSHYLCANAACTSKVTPGSAQPNFQCAEFVSRSIASTGQIAGLNENSPQSAYEHYNYNGKTYDLLWTSNKTGGPLGLEDYLQAAGWKSGGSVSDGSVVFVNGSDGAYGHVAVGVGNNLLDAHNNARMHVPTSYYHVNAVYNK